MSFLQTENFLLEIYLLNCRLSALFWKRCFLSTFYIFEAFVVPTFEENRIFILGMFFLFSHLSPIEIVFKEKFLYPNEDIDFLSSI